MPGVWTSSEGSVKGTVGRGGLVSIIFGIGLGGVAGSLGSGGSVTVNIAKKLC